MLFMFYPFRWQQPRASLENGDDRRKEIFEKLRLKEDLDSKLYHFQERYDWSEGDMGETNNVFYYKNINKDLENEKEKDVRM